VSDDIEQRWTGFVELDRDERCVLAQVEKLQATIFTLRSRRDDSCPCGEDGCEFYQPAGDPLTREEESQLREAENTIGRLIGEGHRVAQEKRAAAAWLAERIDFDARWRDLWKLVAS
jgi:hypothetical protein